MPIEVHQLSVAAHQAVIEKSQTFHPELAYQFILLTAGVRHERAFLKEARKLCYAMLQYDEEKLQEIIFEDVPPLEEFHIAVRDILHAIKKVFTAYGSHVKQSSTGEAQ